MTCKRGISVEPETCAPFLLAFGNLLDFKDKVYSVGIVRDAEESASSAFQSVQSSLANAGLPVPNTLSKRASDSTGMTVLKPLDSEDAAMLKTLMCQTLADSPENWCIESSFAYIAPNFGEPERPEKARVRAFLRAL